MYHQLDVIDKGIYSDLDDDDVFVMYFQSLMKNNLMLMNDIHLHRNLRMILMLVVQYDLIHNREHYEPKENKNVEQILKRDFFFCLPFVMLFH